MARTTHTITRASGYIAAWLTQGDIDSGYAAALVAECNANVPGDPAELVAIPEWPTTGPFGVPAHKDRARDDDHLAVLADGACTVCGEPVDG